MTNFECSQSRARPQVTARASSQADATSVQLSAISDSSSLEDLPFSLKAWALSFQQISRRNPFHIDHHAMNCVNNDNPVAPHEVHCE